MPVMRLTGGGVSFEFGDGTPFPVTGFKRGKGEVRANDFVRARADGVRQGREYRGGASHEISLVVLGDGSSRSERAVSVGERLEVLESAWSGEAVRAGDARLWVGDRYAVGRPREVTVDDAGRWDGSAEVTVVFDAVDEYWWSDGSSVRVLFREPETGGLTFPAEAPFTFDSGPQTRNGVVTVAGAATCWPEFTIHGPVTDPRVLVKSVGELRFTVTLAYDQVLTVDTLHGVVLRDGAPLPGALSPAGSRLSDMGLQPGSYEVELTGYDPTGTGYLDVVTSSAWRHFVV